VSGAASGGAVSGAVPGTAAAGGAAGALGAARCGVPLPGAPCVVAHRGYAAVAPENTLAALAAGALAGATWVEFDVRTTADGVPVVIHDRTVDRTTDGTGRVADLTLDEVLGLDAGSWFSPAHAGLRVPQLGQVLDLLLPTDARLLLEIKPPATIEQVKAVVTEVAERGLGERTVVQSFDPQILLLADEVAPELRRALLRNGFDADPVSVAHEVGAAFYNPSVKDVLSAPDTVLRLRDEGVEVMPWTANDPEVWPLLAATGVAGIITDRAGELIGWRHATPTPTPHTP
jgi:glycerophosphoryl diester phosphodiesterase